MRSWTLGLLLVGCGIMWWCGVASAAITTEQRKEIAEIRKEVGKVSGLISKKEFEEARTILDTSEEKLKGIASAAGIQENDRALAPIFLQIQQRRTLLDKKTDGNGGGGVSFKDDVAPILVARCQNCHNEDRSAGQLKLDTFAGMEAGGANGALVVPGQPQRSLLMARLTATGNARMPRNGPALTAAEITTIGSWITLGAKFDGDDKAAKLVAKAANNTPRNNGPPAPIVRATGDETVSFTKDIAPFMVNLCLGCHSGNNPRGGLSLMTFESLMRGGDSGRVIIPGNMEGSRLFRLVGGLELPRMPQGQARITRQNYEDLKKWFEEGNKFDGPDPKTPLRQLVPTEAEIRAARLSKLSDEEFLAMRKEKMEENWSTANPKEEAKLVESDNFLVYGNVNEGRLKEVSGWAETFAKQLRDSFGVKEPYLWRGKLTIFVFKDRFSYEEFPRVVENAEVPRETIGHSRVTPDFDDAYVCVEDIGDEVSAASPGLKLNVIEHVAGAFLKRNGENIPDWMIRGTGLAIAAADDKKNEYIQGLAGSAAEALQGLEKPEEVFEKGKFPSSDLGPIGYTLVQHIMGAGGPARFGQLISKLQTGQDLAAAIQSTYNANLQTLGLSYINSLGAKRPVKRKK